LVDLLGVYDARLVQIVKKARLVKREVESTESAPKTDSEAKESAVKTDGELKQSAPKTEGELKQSAPKTEGELFTLLLSYWDNRMFSLLSLCSSNPPPSKVLLK
jgi:hypothetical protein